MADGDEIHAGLPKRYLATYQDLCSPDFDPEDVAHTLAKPVLKDAKKFGNSPINFIHDCVEMLAGELSEKPLLRQSVNYGDVQSQIDQMVRQHRGSEQGMELAKRAVRQGLESYRQGGDVLNTVDTVSNYLMQIHEARFSQRVPLTAAHLNNLPSETVTQRLSDTRVHSQTEYIHLAKSIEGRGVDSRINRRPYDRGLGLHDTVQ